MPFLASVRRDKRGAGWGPEKNKWGQTGRISWDPAWAILVDGVPFAKGLASTLSHKPPDLFLARLVLSRALSQVSLAVSLSPFRSGLKPLQ